MAAAVENDTENTVAGGYCGGFGSDHGYGRIARHEVVTWVLVRWSGARRRLTGGESKWRRRNSENFEIMKPWKSVDEDKDEWMAQILPRGTIWTRDNSLPSGAHLWVHAL